MAERLYTAVHVQHQCACKLLGIPNTVAAQKQWELAGLYPTGLRSQVSLDTRKQNQRGDQARLLPGDEARLVLELGSDQAVVVLDAPSVAMRASIGSHSLLRPLRVRVYVCLTTWHDGSKTAARKDKFV